MRRCLVIGVIALLMPLDLRAQCADGSPPPCNRAPANRVSGDSVASRQLTALAVRAVELGKRDPDQFREALRLFDRAIAADPANMDARTRLAELFLDKYNSADAKRTIAEGLAREPRHVPLLVAEARRRAFDNERGADSVLDRALQIEPENAKARVLRAHFRADVEDREGALDDVTRVLKTDSTNADALSFAAALRSVMGDSTGFEATRVRFAAMHPRDARVYVELADMLADTRRYADAAAAARRGIAIDSLNWRARALLGVNLLRLGDVKGAKAALDVAFKGDPFDVWTKNTLDLLDTYSDYDEITRGPFRFVVEKAESDLLALYLGDLAERAHATFVGRYGFTPTPPIRVEVYRSHADFSVRTVGLAGLGALGVSFGNTVAFDSPAAKDAGPFYWGSTAWHELAHTFTLGASDQRVPRWLSEGLSVYEERRAHAGWGQRASPAFIRAYAEGKLRPVSKLNDGFVRPAYPQQVIFSYYQASLVCELIARDWSETALMEMLRAYRAGASTADVFNRVLHTDLAAFDRRFDTYMRDRFGDLTTVLRDAGASVESYAPSAELRARAAAQPRNYWLQMAVGRVLAQRGEHDSALTVLGRAKALFPEYAGGDSPYPLIARALIAKGDRRRAADALLAMIALGEAPYETHVNLATLLLELGDTARAAEVLDGAMFVNPYDIAEHRRLAEISARLGDRRRSIRERLAVVALKPVDRADALYLLAVAYREAGDIRNARRSVVHALEEAPHFERAQELLLALHEGKSP